MTKKKISLSSNLVPWNYSVILLFLLCHTTLFATAYYSRTNGNWNVNSTWSTVGCGGAAAGAYPVAGDNAIICGGYTVTIPAGFSAAANHVIVNSSSSGNGTLTLTAGGGISLTVSGNVNIIDNTSARSSNLATLNVNSTNILTIGGTLNVRGEFHGVNKARALLNLGGGTVTATGVVTVEAEQPSATADITFTGGDLLQLGAAGNPIVFIAEGANLNNGTGTLGTIEYNNAGGQTINVANITNYFNLILSTGGTKTLPNNATVNGNLTVKAGVTLDVNTKTLNAPSSVTLETVGGGVGSIITGSGLFTLGGNITVNYTGAGVITTGATITCPVALGGNRILTVNDDGSTIDSDLSITGIISTAFKLTKAGAGELTLSAANTFTGGVDLNAGILDINNSNALGTVAGTFSIAAGTTIDNTTGATITTLNYPQAWNGDFTFAGTRNLIFGAGNVTMSASRQVTINANILVIRGTLTESAKDLTIAGPGIFRFNTQAVSLRSLTISATSTCRSTTSTLSLTGDFTNNGLFEHNNGLVSFDGVATQTIGGTTATSFYSVTINNSPGIPGDVTLATNNYVVENTLTMTQGNVDLNGRTLSLGTSVGATGTLSYTSGFLYGSTGTFRRWVSATSATMGAIASNSIGHFPMGSSVGDYRPLWLTYTADLSSGGTVSVLHDPTPNTTVATHYDASWGDTLDGVTNSYWQVSTANGFDFNGVTGQIRYGGTGYGSNTLSDLDATLLASVVGTFGAATNVNTTIEVNRTGLSTANLGNTWRIGTRWGQRSPLPIELLLFDAKLNGDNVDLKWTTATEINNDFFTVEKSADAINFETVGTVDGAGNSTSKLHYSLVDDNPYKGVSYYRLKQTDLDGKYTYSNIVAVEFRNADGFNFNVFPNPSTSGSSINVSISSNKDEEVLVVVYDVSGKENYSKIFILQTDGDNVYAIDESGKLAAGVYMITAASNQAIYSKKLIVR